MSNRAWVVDLIHSIGEKTALADHLEEKIRTAEGEEKEQLETMLFKVIDLRREQMSYLLEHGEKPNPLHHCSMKHSIKSFTQDTEVYEATREDATLGFLKASGDILAMALTLYLGMKFETCSRCLEDALLVKEHDDKITVKEKE